MLSIKYISETVQEFLFIRQITVFLYGFDSFMRQKHEKLFADLEFRINQLMYMCNSLREENLSLRGFLDEKNLEIELLNAKLSQLDKKNNNLKVANAMIATNGDSDLDAAKDKLVKLIQNVDKCITLLKI